MQPQASLGLMAKKLQLKNYTPKINLNERYVTIKDINRPALQLYGFYEHFDPQRVQLVGMVEYAYLSTITDEKKKRKMYTQFFSYHDIPCVIFCRDNQPESMLLEIAKENGVPVLGTFKNTADFMVEVISYLENEMAPQVRIHGVLVDVYGIGLLLLGESGIGKSEAALELVRRGHRLVSDDAVQIKRIGYNTLIGTSPEITRNFIELRGVGIIDVKSLFGVECIKLEQEIDFVIRLVEWNQNVQYDRLGNTDNYYDILGVKLVCNEVPIRPGRNLAVICETAAANVRQKMMGYNAADELDRRVRENILN